MKSAELVNRLDGDRLKRAKKSFSTRRVPLSDIATLIEGNLRPESGDLMLARVQKLGHHNKLELENGRRAKMNPDDEIIVCYGNRYASAQYEAVVGEDFSPCHLAASGGIAAQVLSSHASSRPPTRIVPVGLLGDADGKRLNLRDYALSPPTSTKAIPAIAVLGSAMRSGKTAVAASIVRGLTLAGYSVGAAKVTGTGAGGDYWKYLDAGATAVLDFIDAGYSSTYMTTPKETERIFTTLLDHLAERGADVAVMEIADGLFQKETSTLVGSNCFRERVGCIVFAAESALSAVAGVQGLNAQSLPVAAVSGVLTRSPLAMQELSAWTELPVLKPNALRDPEKGAIVWRKLMAEIPADETSNVYPIRSGEGGKEGA